MSAASALSSKTQTTDSPPLFQNIRETVESIVVAFILAFLFRAFVAEAFVIPTGSMAPTLMGAHKDIECAYCGKQYQASASQEFDRETGAPSRDTRAIASTCAACRGINAYDLRGNPNDATFSGDRILVSKFDYVLTKPKRWEVFVFKYPTEARMNYIKRLVGLPGEELLIMGGDVYIKGGESNEPDQWKIARKPPAKIEAMKQVVSDTDYIADILVEKGWPSLWQAWGDGSQGWTVEQSATDWSASLTPTAQLSFLRYYHKVADGQSWRKILSGGELESVDPQSSQLITDFLAYNSSIDTDYENVYLPNGRLRDRITSENRAFDLTGPGSSGLAPSMRPSQGYHWVGDLIGQFDVEILSDTGTLMVDLVEFGVHYRCSIDVATGALELSAQGEELSGSPLGADKLTGKTGINGKGKHQIQMANVDDQIVVWVDRSVVELNQPARFDSHTFRKGKQRRPYWNEEDPLDAAPIGIGGMNVGLKVTRAQVFRDIYYIAPQAYGEYSDYNLGQTMSIKAAVPDPMIASRANALQAVLAVYARPDWWAETDLFSLRGSLQFKLDDDHYFPMGDNSAASSDARAWFGHHFVEKELLLGKALLVFWPHTWNAPVPYTPNISRMGLIR